jgi:hypothetical protein
MIFINALAYSAPIASANCQDFTALNLARVINVRSKLEGLFQASLSGLLYCLRVRPESYSRVEHLVGSHPQILDLARQACQGQTLAY